MEKPSSGVAVAADPDREGTVVNVPVGGWLGFIVHIVSPSSGRVIVSYLSWLPPRRPGNGGVVKTVASFKCALGPS